MLFALVANRALAPSSKLATADWITHDSRADRLAEIGEQSCYRAMDWLHEVKDDLEKQVFDEVANLLDFEVDLLFFDTTSTYFKLEEPDEPVARDDAGCPLGDGQGDEDAKVTGFRAYGKSKDSRDDDWTLSKVVWVTDRGFSSEANRRYLRQGEHAYIIGKKLRSGSPEAKAALSRQGRYTEIAENMRVKEVLGSNAWLLLLPGRGGGPGGKPCVAGGTGQAENPAQQGGREASRRRSNPDPLTAYQI
ncbi:hypothetical protein ABT187_47655 [Streptomyces sp. NPDC001817]|uniref:hypothetical protein n=1 Tax=Streptomyces sp. NPDC001817 TaxID=3154398 RepID=UPI0033269E6E